MSPDAGECDDGRGLCAHCQLPLPGPWWGRGGSVDAARDDEPAYCCFGCRLAASIARESSGETAARRTLTRLGLSVFFTMNVIAFTMALWTADVYRLEGSTPLMASLDGLFRQIVMLFALPVLFLLGWPLAENALASVRRGVFSTDLLLAAGVAASFAYSVVSVIRGSGPVYFEVGCVVLVMVTLGRWFEATGKLKANDALDRLARLMPERVRRVHDGQEQEAALSEVAVGDVLRVLPGERIPADGRVTRGRAFVDEQVFTGESRPAPRQPGDPVLGGTLNLDGDLFFEVTASAVGGTLQRLIALVRHARAAKGQYERLADQVSAWFVPAVTLVALLTFAVHTRSAGLDRGLLQGLAVVLIACPCALGLATPLAVWTAMGRAASEQVLFRSGEALERLAEIRAVRFDKTGTLTTGTPALCGLVCEDDDRLDVVSRAAALAGASTHVLARAILRQAEPPGVSAAEVRTLPGRGLAGLVEGPAGVTLLGSRRLMDESGFEVGPRLAEAESRAERSGRSLVFVGWNERARGLFVFDEQLRPSAPDAIAQCQALGLDVGVLTGDHAACGEALARALGVDVKSSLLPEDKVRAVAQVHEQIGAVAMVGDGVNDAPALASSDSGVAMGCGADLSRDSAAVCLLGDDLTRLPWAIALARQTVRVIRANLAWAFGYNSVGVALAACGWLSPAIAALLMVGSSAFVITNSLRLGRGNPLGGPAGTAGRDQALFKPSGRVSAVPEVSTP